MIRNRRSRKKRRSESAWIFFLAPSILGVLLFVVLPFVDVIRRSFLTAVSGEFSGITNYKVIFESEAFRLALINTVRFTVICIPLLVALGLCVALPLSKCKQAQLVKSLYLFPLAMPTATIVIVWKMLFEKQGFLNRGLTWLAQLSGAREGPISTDYMETGAAFFVLAGSYIWKNLGYTVILWLAGIQSIAVSVLEAAKVDGAGKRQRFRYIMLPNLKGSLYVIVVLSFLNSFKIYREAYLVSGSYPDESIYLLQHLFNNWFVNLELDKMAAAAVVTGGILLLCILMLQRGWDRESG